MNNIETQPCPFEAFLASPDRETALLINRYIASQPALATVLTRVARAAYFAGGTDMAKQLLTLHDGRCEPRAELQRDAEFATLLVGAQ